MIFKNLIIIEILIVKDTLFLSLLKVLLLGSFEVVQIIYHTLDMACFDPRMPVIACRRSLWLSVG